MPDDTLHELAIDILDRFERRLHAVARAHHVNAVLWLAEPSLVLPSPAVGLVELRAAATTVMKPHHVLRSVEPLGPDGDVLLSIVPADFVAHAWSVARTAWSTDSASASGPDRRRFGIRGLEVSLERRPGASWAPGELSLCFPDDAMLSWALERARVTCEGEPLPLRRFPSPLRLGAGAPGGVAPVHHHLEAIMRPLFMVGLPRRAGGDALTLRFHFEEPLSLGETPEPPRVHANVVPVWNSIDCVHPARGHAEQATSESQHRRLHPLSPSDLGASWRAWSVAAVGAADDARLRFARQEAFDDAGNLGEYQLVVGRRDSAGRKESGDAVLSVLVDERGRRALDERSRKLRVDYRATTGSRANHAGGTPDAPAEFELRDPFGLSWNERLVGRLIGSLWGGVDGWITSATGDLEELGVEALLGGGPRSVADVASILERWFGNELELVDERDLIRTSSRTTAPLAIHLRFKRPDRASAERAVVLRSCRHFLAGYLGATAHGGFDLVDAEPVVHHGR